MVDQNIILVNEKDEAVGLMEKMQVHREGLLHRAFSVFVFDRNGRMLLQKRAAHKYHGGGLWSNACCSHPYPGEKVEDAAQRRLHEEMGFVTPLQKIFEFVYKADVENGLIEHEYDHVFAGEYEGPINMNQKEVADYCYESMNNIKWMIRDQPHKFTSWFKLAFPSIETWWVGRY
jgi:isopentenyl-diphosphate delta-isomerase